jgi:hypothetical protein
VERCQRLPECSECSVEWREELLSPCGFPRRERGQEGANVLEGAKRATWLVMEGAGSGVAIGWGWGGEGQSLRKHLHTHMLGLLLCSLHFGTCQEGLYRVGRAGCMISHWFCKKIEGRGCY